MLLPALLLLLAPTPPPPIVFGDWQSPAASVIRIAPCGPAVCLQVVKLPPEATATTDIYNPNPALHTRKLCGLTVGTGFKPEDATHLTGGELYDPKTGHTYRGNLTLEGDTLQLRGYIGVPLFGRTETWHRIAPIEPCK